MKFGHGCHKCQFGQHLCDLSLYLKYAHDKGIPVDIVFFDNKKATDSHNPRSNRNISSTETAGRSGGRGRGRGGGRGGRHPGPAAGRSGAPRGPGAERERSCRRPGLRPALAAGNDVGRSPARNRHVLLASQ